MINTCGNPTFRPSAQLVRQELERVLSSACFVRSPVLSRRLSFLVEGDLAGQTGNLKETFVGHACFGRELTYDPKLDSVVRVNANRLRLRLDEYYGTCPDAHLRIALNKGSYVPIYVCADEKCDQRDTLLDRGVQEDCHPVRSPSSRFADVSEPQIPLSFSQAHDVEVVTEAVAASSPFGWLTPKKLRRLVGTLVFLLAVGTLVVTAVNRGRRKSVWQARPFSSLEGLQEFSDFSPDGAKVAFSRLGSDGKNHDIYIQGIHADTPQRLTMSPAEDTRPAWSPDGHLIAFIRLFGPQRKELDILSLITGKETKVAELDGMTPWLCEIPRLSWSHDGAEIYSSESLGAGQACGIIAVSVTTGDIRPVTRPPSGVVADVEAALSPDGTKLAFLRNSETLGGDIYVVDVSGGSPQRVTFDNRDIMGFCWSADGKSFIAASRRGDGVVKLWRMPLKAGDPEQLTDGSVVATFPAASLSGDRITFTTYRNVTSIWRSDGSSEIQLIDNQSGNSAPVSSPDGTRVAYRSDRTGPFEIWISDRDGHNSRRLTHFNGPMVDNPAWSPDGEQIAIECRDRSHSDICLIPTNGSSGLERLTHWNSNQILPSWSHDGRSLYYGSNFSGRWEIYKQSLGGGDPVQITHRGGMRAVESWDGRYLYVHRGEPLGGIVVLPIGSTNKEPDGNSEESTIVLNQLNGGMWGDWDEGPGGIVFLSPSPDGKTESVERLDLVTGSKRTLAAISGTSPKGDRVFSVVPDGNTILYVRTTADDGQLEILERNK
jgi:Tol biopolymer transport system component